jgi:NAD(P)-dependent dehydrogenase (short-subunit alcohol dehydrogenase family)
MKAPFIDFKGMRVLVSGASSGIGRAIAVELSRRGAGLILQGQNRGRLEETAAMLENSERHILVMDLRNTGNVFAALKDFAGSIGRIYGLCHSAGVAEILPLAVAKPDHLRRMLEINLVAGVELARVISRQDIMEPGGGSLLFISSIGSMVGSGGQIGYCASKGAVSAAARAMAVELARRNIRVNTLCPGMVRTPMTEKAFSAPAEAKSIMNDYPLGIGTPEDVARAAVFLLAPQNRWITGIDLVVDGGFTAK